MSHVFISYVREDEGLVRLISNVFRENGVKYWLDKNDIQPGARWQNSIKDAIASGSRFLSINTRNSAKRAVSGANEELVIAVDEIRKRPQDAVWFIPWKNDDTPIPERSIGGGETLADLQWIDAHQLGWREAMRRLLHACGVETPVLDPGEPLSSALPSSVAVRSGEIEYLSSEPAVEGFDGTIHSITEGLVRRGDDKRIVVRIVTRAGHRRSQQFADMIGMSDIYAYADDSFVSEDPARPTKFIGESSWFVNRGEKIFHPSTGEVSVPADMHVKNTFSAWGTLAGNVVSGEFEVSIVSSILGQSIPARQTGNFSLCVERHG